MSDNPQEIQGELPSTQTVANNDAPEWYASVPAKFKDPTGAPNFEGLTKSYVELEKRFSTVERAPESHDKYALPQLEGVQLDDAKFAPFKEWAHKNGFTQKQFEAATQEYLSVLSDVTERFTWTPEKAEVELRKEWSDPKVYDKNRDLADRFLRAYTKEGEYESLRNNPEFIRLASVIGAELNESGRVNHAAILPEQDVKSLLASRAYADPSHPEHAATHAKVQAHYQNLQKRRA